MPGPIPPPLSLALSHLRTARGRTQQELARGHRANLPKAVPRCPGCCEGCPPARGRVSLVRVKEMR